MTDFEQNPAPPETRDFAVPELPATEPNGISDAISDTIDAIQRDLTNPASEAALDKGAVIADSINGSATRSDHTRRWRRACEGTEILPASVKISNRLVLPARSALRGSSIWRPPRDCFNIRLQSR